jgi:DUF971 family protein
MTAAPTDIKAIRGERTLQITWEPGHVGRYAFVMLRGECNCAACVDEHTGVRILDRSKIPTDITINNMQLVGNYAARIHWSDGHSTGLYTWQHLRELCPCQQCRKSA